MLEIVFRVDWMLERLDVMEDRLDSTVANPLVTDVEMPLIVDVIVASVFPTLVKPFVVEAESAVKSLVMVLVRLVTPVCSDETPDWTAVNEEVRLEKSAEIVPARVETADCSP